MTLLLLTLTALLSHVFIVDRIITPHHPATAGVPSSPQSEYAIRNARGACSTLAYSTGIVSAFGRGDIVYCEGTRAICPA